MPSTTATDLVLRRAGTLLVLEGDVTGPGLDALGDAFAHAAGVDTLDLSGADFPEGPALGRLVDVVRALSSGSDRFWIVGAPQAFAHVLYRTGDLARVELVDVRFDEGAAW